MVLRCMAGEVRLELTEEELRIVFHTVTEQRHLIYTYMSIELDA